MLPNLPKLTGRQAPAGDVPPESPGTGKIQTHTGNDTPFPTVASQVLSCSISHRTYANGTSQKGASWRWSKRKQNVARDKNNNPAE